MSDFCRHCGASIPPRHGEGTCPKCDPAGGLDEREYFEDADHRVMWTLFDDDMKESLPAGAPWTHGVIILGKDREDVAMLFREYVAPHLGNPKVGGVSKGERSDDEEIQEMMRRTESGYYCVLMVVRGAHVDKVLQ